jgi:hypothetical protein
VQVNGPPRGRPCPHPAGVTLERTSTHRAGARALRGLQPAGAGLPLMVKSSHVRNAAWLIPSRQEATAMHVPTATTPTAREEVLVSDSSSSSDIDITASTPGEPQPPSASSRGDRHTPGWVVGSQDGSVRLREARTSTLRWASRRSGHRRRGSAWMMPMVCSSGVLPRQPRCPVLALRNSGSTPHRRMTARPGPPGTMMPTPRSDRGVDHGDHDHPRWVIRCDVGSPHHGGEGRATEDGRVRETSGGAPVCRGSGRASPVTRWGGDPVRVPRRGPFHLSVGHLPCHERRS